MRGDAVKVKKDYKSLVKHNHLIRGKYSLEASEQKLLYKLFEHIQKNNYTTKELTLSFVSFYREFKSILGKNLSKADFKNLIEGLQDKKPYIIIGDEFIRTQWYKIRGKLDYEEVKLIIDDDVFKYIQVQEKNFTMLRLESVYSFKKFYTMRIYELLKQWSNTKSVITLSICDLKKHLDIEENPGYKNYSNIRKYILDPATEEINEKSELTINYKPLKEGRKVIAIEFTIMDQLPAFKNQAISEPAQEPSPVLEDEVMKNVVGDINDDKFYIPEPGYLDTSVVRGFINNFKDIDFNDEDNKQAFIDAAMITCFKDGVEVITPTQYGLFRKTLKNKLDDIQFKKGMEDADFLNNIDKKDWKW